MILTYGFYTQHRAISDLRAARDTEAAAARAIEQQLTLLRGELLANETRMTIFHSIVNSTNEVLMECIRKTDKRIDAVEMLELRRAMPYPVDPPPPLTEEQLDDLRNGIIPEGMSEFQPDDQGAYSL